MGRRLLFSVALATLVVALAGTSHAAEGAEGHGDWTATAGRIVNFAILVGVLAYFLRRPLANYLDARAEQIRRELAEAEDKRARAELERQKAAERLAGLDEEVERVRARAREEAEAERRRILETAEAEARRLTEQARKEIAAELEIARRNLLARAAELSVRLARQKIESTMTDEDRRALVERSIERLREVR